MPTDPNLEAAAQDMSNIDTGTQPLSRVSVPAVTAITPPPTLAPKNPADYGLDSALKPEVMAGLDTATIDAITNMQSSVSQLQKVSDSYLKGEIPADVQAQVRRVTSERGLASGLGRGQAGQALTARDLGLTSLDLQSQGANLATASSAINESLTRIAQGRYQFDKQYALESQKFMEMTRQGDMDATRLELARRQFNAETNLKLVGMIGDMASERARLQVQMAGSSIEDTNVVGSIDQVIAQFQSLIEKASKEA